MVNSSQTRLSIVPEVTWGVTPATPTYTNVRFTGESLNVSRETVTSDEIRPDRNVSDLTQVSGSAAGDIQFELAYDPAFELILESFLHSTWSSDVIKNGVTQKSLTVEKTFELGATDVYTRMTGMIANQLSLTCTAKQKITGSVSFMGKGGTVSNAAVAGSTYTAASTTPICNAASGFANLTIDGLTGPRVRTLSLQAQNNLRSQDALGSFDAAGIGSGRFVVTGNIEVYLVNKELIDLYLNGTAAGLEFTLGTVTGEKYTISLPTLKFSKADVVAGGNDQDVMVSASFQGLYDSSSASTLTITRAVA